MGRHAYRARVSIPSRTSVWLTALAVGLLQVMGSFGAADRQPDRRSLNAVAIVLLLVGPAALAVRDRWPLVAVAVSMAAADVYVGLGYPYGPIFLSPIVALFLAIQDGHRRAAWALAAAGYAGLIVAYSLDSRSDHSNALLHFALVAGWLIVVVVVSELVRARREQAAARAQVAPRTSASGGSASNGSASRRSCTTCSRTTSP